MHTPFLTAILAALESPAPRLSTGAGPDLTRYALLCAALIALTVGAAWLFKRLALRTVAGRAAKRSLRVIDVLPLGGRQKIAVVRCYDRTFLLGMGEKEVSALAELDPAIGGQMGAAVKEVADREAFARALETVRRNLEANRRRPAPEPKQSATGQRVAAPAPTPAERRPEPASEPSRTAEAATRSSSTRLEGIVA